jgi:hypothetical protein
MVTTLIGIDCAVQSENVGVALGGFDGRRVWLDTVVQGRDVSVIDTVGHWLGSSTSALLAVDAPLGWPVALGQALKRHRAGALLRPEPDRLFRRETDRVVREVVGKQSLDVGVDRIARTAHAALALLDALRTRTGQPIPLAWTPALATAVSAIEVYPAATLKVRRMETPGYKDKDGQAQRQSLLKQLGRQVRLPTDTRRMVESDDALDAAICVLAGADFLRGPVVEPADRAIAEKEGWIWVRQPAKS